MLFMRLCAVHEEQPYNKYLTFHLNLFHIQKLENNLCSALYVGNIILVKNPGSRVIMTVGTVF